MRAAVFNGPGRPLEVGGVPTPSPGPGEALVKVAGCGLCHTDLHYLDHGVKTFKTPPLILGHEAAGTVHEVGAGVTGRARGDRVLIPAVLSWGGCRYCRRGRENLCDKMSMLGNNVDGAYAEYVAVPAAELVPVPDGIPLEQACVIADAVSTPYHAVTRRARVRAGDWVAVVGCGGVDVAFEAIGNPKTMQLAYGLLRRGGRLCVIGYSAEEVSLSAAKLMYYELEVVGSLGCGAGEYPEILGLVQAGRIRLDDIVSGTIPLAQINDGLDRLRRGEGVRWVIVP